VATKRPGTALVSPDVQVHSGYSPGGAIMEKVDRLYVGIDVHSRQHKVAMMTTQGFSQRKIDWKQARFLTIKNKSEDFNILYSEIQTLVRTLKM
jgi:hypothetical protein